MGSEIMYIVELEIYIYIRSIVNEVIRTISDRFFFTKIFIYKNTIKRTEKNKDNNFWRIKTSKKGKNICSLMLFVRCKPFRKKKTGLKLS